MKLEEIVALQKQGYMPYTTAGQDVSAALDDNVKPCKIQLKEENLREIAQGKLKSEVFAEIVQQEPYSGMANTKFFFKPEETYEVKKEDVASALEMMLDENSHYSFENHFGKWINDLLGWGASSILYPFSTTEGNYYNEETRFIVNVLVEVARNVTKDNVKELLTNALIKLKPNCQKA